MNRAGRQGASMSHSKNSNRMLRPYGFHLRNLGIAFLFHGCSPQTIRRLRRLRRSVLASSSVRETDAPQQLHEARLLPERIKVKVDAQPYQQPGPHLVSPVQPFECTLEVA